MWVSRVLGDDHYKRMSCVTLGVARQRTLTAQGPWVPSMGQNLQPLPLMVTSPNEWKIIEWEYKQLKNEVFTRACRGIHLVSFKINSLFSNYSVVMLLWKKGLVHLLSHIRIFWERWYHLRLQMHVFRRYHYLRLKWASFTKLHTCIR